MRDQLRRFEEIFVTILGRDVDARGQAGLVEQARLRGVRKLNTVYFHSDTVRSLDDIYALQDPLGSTSCHHDTIVGQ